ncbi:MAG TPA: class I adenylate-forming enzyme family protein [Candidatus Limnocylindrales bacterium]|nr:class I adenylate-forming enzyme family protein [Candidatus Limnocylindrales bacterium]
MSRPPRTVPGFLAWRASLDPDHVAIEVRGGTKLTLADWHERANAAAHGLRERGVRRGDRVALVFGPASWPEFAVAYCAVQRAGAVAMPLTARLSEAQIAYALTHSGATALLHDGTPPNVTGVWTATPADVATQTRLPLTEPMPDSPAQILYTSGTTGRPKGVTATHANLTIGAPWHPKRLRLGHSNRFAHAFEIGTNAAQTMLLNALYTKAGSLTLARATPARFARLIADTEVGTVFLVPALAVELLGALGETPLDHVHLVGSTAAPLPPVVARRLASMFPNAAVVNYYTSTEAAPAQTEMIFDPGRPDAIGQPTPGTLMIADGAGKPLRQGATGEVWLHSSHPREYFRDPVATGDTFQGEWVRMGDLGRLDADGYLYLVDRCEDVVKTGAFKVSTVEVEAALFEHPQVADAAVVGVPHPVLGHVLAAVVVPAGSEPSLPELRRFLSTRLADYQLPARLVLRDQLPRNAGGKVHKRQLAAGLAGPPEGAA